MIELENFKTYCHLSINLVSEKYGIDVTEKIRTDEIVFYRFALIDIFLREFEKINFKRSVGDLIITDAFNQKRTSIYNSIKQHNNLIGVGNEKYTALYNEIKELI